MKTIIPKLSILSLFFSIVFISCSKEKRILDRNTTLLIEKRWIFERYGLDENNNGSIEETENNILPCEADDTYAFFANGSGFYEGGPVPCSLGETTIINFTWRFENNCTELAIFAAPEKISQLDENILEVYYIDVNSQGQPVKYIRRFRH
jgi:hypothetical protein